MVLTAGVLLTAAGSLQAQKVGLVNPFEAPRPNVSFGYTYFDGRFESSSPLAFEGESADEFRLRQEVVGARVSQRFFRRVHAHVDAGLVENRLDGARFQREPAYGGGLQVLLIPEPDLYLVWTGSFLIHDTAALRGDPDTRMSIRNDWQTGFLLGREGGAQNFLGEEFTGSRTYIGGLYSAREVRVRSDDEETFQHKRLVGILGVVGVQLDLWESFGLAVEGHAGAAYGGSGWLYYRF